MARHTITISCMIMVLAVLAPEVCIGQAGGGERRVVRRGTKELTGTISGINANSISLAYQHDEKKGIEYETLLPLDPDIEIQHKRILKDFKPGDMVTVMFEEVVTEDAKQGQRIERKAKSISFVRSAEKKPEQLKPPEPGEGLPDDMTPSRPPAE